MLKEGGPPPDPVLTGVFKPQKSRFKKIPPVTPVMEASLGFTFVGEIQVHGAGGPTGFFHNRWVVLGGSGVGGLGFSLEKIGVGGAF